MKKRCLSMLLALCLLLAVLPAGVLAAEATSGTCGENLTWTLEDGILTISGTGDMTDYENEADTPWSASRESITAAVIEPGVTNIGAYAFAGCDYLTSVTMPGSVTRIGAWAFSECYGLSDVVIPDGVTLIGSFAFLFCQNMKSITIPDSVTSIVDGAFTMCSGLTSITLPDSVERICYGVFAGCAGLTDVVIPDSVTYIDDEAFGNCYSLTSITIPDSVTYMGVNVFVNCEKLTSVTIPGSVDRIKSQTFYGCSSLTDVTISDGVTSIGPDAFTGCSNLTSVTVPASVTAIDERALGYNFNWDYEEITYFPVEGFTISGYPGTAAETYAADNGFVFEPIAFDDVAEGVYYAEPVAWAVANGITNGTSETTFSPNNGCTRAQAVTFLWRAAGRPEPESSENPFTDVTDDTYYDDAVLWAMENGITDGVAADRFAPNSTCTRAQIVTFLYRFADQPAVGGAAFPDVPEDSYYADAVRWAVANDITNGNGGNFFSPENTCTRAQIVTFLYRDLA